MSDDDASGGEDPSERDDPFDRLGYDTEREGDPFERLDDEDTRESTDQQVPTDDEPWVPPGEDRRDATRDDDTWEDAASVEPESTGGEVADPDRTVIPDQPADSGPVDGPDGPFANVDTPTESPFDDGGSVFERVDSGGADPDQVWESITGEDDGDDGDDGDDVHPSVPADGRYSDVSKHRFCEQCEHFSPPPDVSCGHHAAEIIEFLDMETVRLLDCPVVAEREQLERHE